MSGLDENRPSLEQQIELEKLHNEFILTKEEMDKWKKAVEESMIRSRLNDAIMYDRMPFTFHFHHLQLYPYYIGNLLEEDDRVLQYYRNVDVVR